MLAPSVSYLSDVLYTCENPVSIDLVYVTEAGSIDQKLF